MMDPIIINGDCIAIMAALPEASIDAIVTDPPYGLGFMGKGWDALPPGREWADECLRVLKPGGHLLAFGGTRTWHRLAVAVEDAGFELRDSIAWMYGSGMPKGANLKGDWQGWGTSLKPAFEPIVMGRKPLSGTVAANVLVHGTGGINVDACRIEGAKPATTRGASVKASSMNGALGGQGRIEDDGKGRWPANVVLDESMAAELDAQSGTFKGRVGMKQHGSGTNAVYGKFARSDMSTGHAGVEDEGGASRFFYVAKAGKKERPVVDGVAHPTVKPIALMRWLCRLVTPPGGRILEPFAGSGTTIEAAMLEGFDIVAIERETEYLPLIQARIDRAKAELGEVLISALDVWGGVPSISDFLGTRPADGGGA